MSALASNVQRQIVLDLFAFAVAATANPTLPRVLFRRGYSPLCQIGVASKFGSVTEIHSCSSEKLFLSL